MKIFLLIVLIALFVQSIITTKTHLSKKRWIEKKIEMQKKLYRGKQCISAEMFSGYLKIINAFSYLFSGMLIIFYVSVFFSIEFTPLMILPTIGEISLVTIMNRYGNIEGTEYDFKMFLLNKLLDFCYYPVAIVLLIQSIFQ